MVRGAPQARPPGSGKGCVGMKKTMTAYAMGGLLATILAAPVCAAVPADWAVKEAPIRFVYDLGLTPSHPSAGYFVTIPDGGLLPDPAPNPMVFDEAGNALTNGVLWHSSGTGCGLVFQAPKEGQKVVIYVGGARQLTKWTPQTGLTPSAMFCASLGSSARAVAMQLGGLGTVGPQVQFSNKAWAAGQWENVRIPLAMWWDTYPGGIGLYMMAYVNVTDPGPTWVAPLIRQGVLDIAIDGQMLHLAKINDKRGGVGTSVTLAAGLHKVDLYGYNFPGGDGGMMLTWRPPHTKIEDLGGPRGKDKKYPGTPFFESRMIQEDEIVKSGTADISDIQTRDGGPIASFTVTARHVYWFEGEEVLIDAAFAAWTKNNPEGTRCTWRFDSQPGAVASGAELNWLVKGSAGTWVTLTAEADGKRSSSRILVNPQTDVKSSLDDPPTREAFRSACYAMLKAQPEKGDPVATWNASMWNNFFRVLNLQMENSLVEHIVTQRWDFFKKKLTEDKRSILEDLFLISMGARKPKETIPWVAELSKDAPSRTRSVMLQLKSAEILMYYLGDLDGARKIITPLLSEGGEGGEWARIRMGDLELLAGNLPEATQRYGDVQSRSKANTAEASAAVPQVRDTTPSGPVKSADFARLKAPPKAGVQKTEEVEPPPNVAYWKLAAVRDAAASENVATLIDQEFYLEALKALRVWERTFPMNKITGDYILREAKLYMALKDYKRARVMLTAYCDQVDASSFLSEALKMTRKCMILTTVPEAEVAKFEQDIRNRKQLGTEESPAEAAEAAEGGKAEGLESFLGGRK